MSNSLAAFDLDTGNGHTSVALYRISVAEFQTHRNPCEEDSLPANEELRANPAHALAGFVGFGGSRQKTLAKRIKQAAIARGVPHPNPADEIDETANGDGEIPIVGPHLDAQEQFGAS